MRACLAWMQLQQSFEGCQKCWLYILMMDRWVLLHPVLGIACHPWPPKEMEFVLNCLPLLESMEPHAHCFGIFRLDLAMNYTLVCHFVCLHWCWWLWMSHLHKHLFYVNCISCNWCILIPSLLLMQMTWLIGLFWCCWEWHHCLWGSKSLER